MTLVTLPLPRRSSWGQLDELQVPTRRDLVPLSQSFKLILTAQKGNVVRTLQIQRSKRYGPSRKKAPAHWRYKTMGHEMQNGAEVIVKHREPREATKTRWVREVSLEEASWEETLVPSSFLISVGWKREVKGKEKFPGTWKRDRGENAHCLVVR